MSRILVVINDPSQGTERVYAALRLATSPQKKQAGLDLRIFLVGNGASCGNTGQTGPSG